MAKHITVTSKQKAAAGLSLKRSAVSGRFVSKATKAIADAQPRHEQPTGSTTVRK